MKLTKIDDLTFVVKFDDHVEAATKLQAMEDQPEIGSDEERGSYHEAVVKNEILKYMSKRYGSNVGLIKQTVCRRAAVVRAFGSVNEFGLIPKYISESIRKMLSDGTIMTSKDADTENGCSVSLTAQGAEYIKTIK
mgnify:CR=1 FL=1